MPGKPEELTRTGHHVRMMREYLQHRVEELEETRKRAEYQLEEAQQALAMFEAKGRMAEKLA